MDKKKANPRKPPPEDFQGHSYQHELGDPDRAKQIENKLQDATDQHGFSPGPRQNILVTGSSGLIGSRVMQALSSEYKMIGIDRSRPTRPEDLPEGSDFIECDLTSDDSVARAIDTIRERHGDHLASVIHLAAYYNFSGEPSELYDKLTIQGTMRLLKELSDFAVEQFVFSSTILVMEPAQEDELLTETSPLEDEPWDYPRSKILTEEFLRRERGNIPMVILRIAGVYDEFGHTVPVAQQINRIYQEELESYFFPGNASHGQAFVHMDDLVDSIYNVVTRRKLLNPMETFLIAEPDLMSYRELQDELGKLLHGVEWTTVWIPKFLAKAGAWAQGVMGKETFIKPWMVDLADDHYPVSIDRAREKLGWEPKHRLRHTLPKIVENLKRDPVGWFEINKLPVPDKLRRSA